ncbi:PPOX class F420-dependent oxidoreductase [Streptomyces fuscigenes]|uniref:PPOX class F420-dependent oxidoreductase n=1 Tax=Streptomyces fuscigenes TaxID=1528880 RepID=UPI001F215127|nr:PPOX class F420-dependent oxidoreductase [Streptomyces fuscigenes]MCF3960169.1 PPOX class F420-dependent oxidoreductase [Streptomyces fuscigenes]
MSVVPSTHVELLTRPLFGHLGTLRADGAPQVNPVWFEWDGERLWFTTTTDRYKYRNIAGDPRVSLSVDDPDRPYRYLEVRGVVDTVRRDPSALGYLRLAARYGLDVDRPVGGVDANRVLLGLVPRHATCQ